MRPGWNPGRRNRHVGTKAHGHGDDNRLVIPERFDYPSLNYRLFHERLSSYVTVQRTLGARPLTFIVEPTRPGWFYPCTVDDACRLLSQMPQRDLATVDMVVMRQATRKQRILSPVWGRAQFQYTLSDAHKGRAILLEAQSTATIGWSRSLSPESRRELQRLRTDGHEVTRTRRGWEISGTPASLRHTVLYRTLLHELGHHVDYQRSGNDWDTKTRSAKEDFAHRYATEAFARLNQRGLAPFEQQADRTSLERDRLNPAWFGLASFDGKSHRETEGAETS